MMKCYEYNKCGRECCTEGRDPCIGAISDKCWETAGTFSIPPQEICMLLESATLTSCTECLYYKLVTKLDRSVELANELKAMLSDLHDLNIELKGE